MADEKIFDTVVIGAGPNGLAAAVTLARAGRRVLVREANHTIGGGTRSGEITLPGFLHDLCSAVHPLAASSPFFRDVPLAAHGLEFIHPTVCLAHPFDDGTAALLQRSIGETAATLGRDGESYRNLMEPLAADWNDLLEGVLSPFSFPRHPFKLARFGLKAIRSAQSFVSGYFTDYRARALFAGCAAHSFLPLENTMTAAFGLMLGVSGHAVGWPVVRGGSQQIADALAAYLRSLGGKIQTNARVDSLDELASARLVMCDITPRQLLRIAGERLPANYRRQLQRYRYGMGAFKVDYALDGAIPWTAKECALAGTVHLGGTFEEIAASERAAWRGEQSERPFVLLAQQSLFDAARAPEGKHTVWAYCHVPHGSTFDMAERIENQIERFAPGFRERILARSVTTPADLERRNANLIGGDINGGVQDIWQAFARPVFRFGAPYATPVENLYLCSSSTPPGGGVHGMCGYNAARTALRQVQ